MRSNPHLELEELPVGGLRPRCIVVVEAGVSREEVKEYFLARGVGFSGPAILDPAGFCRHILSSLVDAKKVLTPTARQEVLRYLLARTRGMREYPELKRLRRARGFFKKLDRSIQTGRMTFASRGELEAQLELLDKFHARSQVRREVWALTEVYEEWLQERKYWDLPRLLVAAIGVVVSPEVPLDLPEQVVVLSAARGESRSEALWESLASRTMVERVVLSELGEALPPEVLKEEIEPKIRWEKWHSLDDAVESLADELHAAAMAGELVRHGVLIPDDPGVRRSLKRALTDRGVVFEDPRDPTRLRWEEGMKTALLPLNLAARQYPREEVAAFLRSPFCGILPEALPRIFSRIQDLGIRHGLDSYAAPGLEALHRELLTVERRFGGRKTLKEIEEAHLECLDRVAEQGWIAEFFEKTYAQFAFDLEVISRVEIQAPTLFWLERIRDRLEDATPPVERVKWRGGLSLFRLNQTPLSYPEKLWCLSLPSQWLTGESPADYWLSDRERDRLSGSFPVRSGAQIAQDRKKSLGDWFQYADEIRILDASYDWNGKEREDLGSLFAQIGIDPEAHEMGAHPRWMRSLSTPKREAAREIAVPSLESEGVKEISASALEDFSRCGFLGLARRWRLGESKEAEAEIAPDARGTLLHAAVRILTENRDDNGVFSITSKEALDRAWAEEGPKRLIVSPRTEAYAKSSLIPILEAFRADETEYTQMSRTRILSLEGEDRQGQPVELRYHTAGIDVKGVADRIDEHPDGLFVIDYKSSTASPTGQKMIDLGYRLQLPLYALAAQNHFKKNALGVQFVALTRKPDRKRGIFFPQYSDKTGSPGTLVKIATKANKSLITEMEPQEAWNRLADQIEIQTQEFASGSFKVEPRLKTECDRCRLKDACGRRRWLTSEGSAEEEAAE